MNIPIKDQTNWGLKIDTLKIKLRLRNRKNTSEIKAIYKSKTSIRIHKMKNKGLFSRSSEIYKFLLISR